MRMHGLLGAALLMAMACSKPGGDECKPTTPAAAARPMACEVDGAQPSSGEPASASLTETDPSPLEANAAPNDDAAPLIREALRADRAGDLELCITKEKEALKIDDSARARLHLASCESRKGKLVDSLKDSQRALERGIVQKDASVMKVARIRVKETLARVPHITFRKVATTPPLKLTFDGKDVPYDAADKKFSVDPGAHTVEVTTLDGKEAVVSRCYLQVAERTMTPITIR